MIQRIPECASNWFEFPINYDNRVLTCSLYWSEELEQQYNALVTQLKVDAYNDPLVRVDGSYDREYDVAAYYQAGNPLTSHEMYDEWYEAHKDNLPMSVKYMGYMYFDLRRIIMDRSITYYNIQNTISMLREQCVWTFSINDENDIVTGVLNPGAAYERDSRWTMWVRSDTRISIGREDLPYVTLEFV